MALGPRLRQLRTLAGLSQNELAKRADVPRPVISDVESGKQRSMNLETARKLARVLGVTLDFLAGPGEETGASSNNDDEPAKPQRPRTATLVG